jgi:hypothetical protein
MYRPLAKTITCLLLPACFLSACKKDHDKSRTDLLTEKEWKYVDYGVDDDNNGVISSEESNLEACEKDDTFKFSSNGSLLVHDNTTRCTSGAETDTLYWSFLSNETQIVLNTGGLLTIKTLTGDKLEISSETLDNGGNVKKLITVFAH